MVYVLLSTMLFCYLIIIVYTYSFFLLLLLLMLRQKTLEKQPCHFRYCKMHLYGIKCYCKKKYLQKNNNKRKCNIVNIYYKIYYNDNNNKS